MPTPITIPRPIPLTEDERRSICRALELLAAVDQGFDWTERADTLRELALYVLGDLDPEGDIR